MNFIMCIVFCDLCLKNGTWDQPLSVENPCVVCGPARWYSWSPKKYHKTTCDIKYDSDTPLEDFLEWTLKYWKGSPYQFAPLDETDENGNGGSSSQHANENGEEFPIQFPSNGVEGGDEEEEDEEEEEVTYGPQTEDEARGITRMAPIDSFGLGKPKEKRTPEQEKKEAKPKEVWNYCYSHYGGKYDNVS